jgi:hypothetical protein
MFMGRNKFEVFSKPSDAIKIEVIRSLEDDKIYKTTLEKRFFDVADYCVSLIKEREVKKAISNVNKYYNNEKQDFRTLRKIESMFQNRILSLIIGRDSFFRNSALDNDIYNKVVLSATQFYKQIMDDSHVRGEGIKIAKGINSVYKYIVPIFNESFNSKEKTFVGTNDYLDAAHEIDLIVSKEKNVDLVQVKTSIMDQTEIDKIHNSHAEFVKRTHKNSIGYLHILIENYSSAINTKENKMFNEHIEDVHSLLEWMKPLFDEKSKFAIDDSFINESKSISEIDSIDISQMAVLFQRGGILHNIFMKGDGEYSKIFNKIIKNIDFFSKKEKNKIKGGGIVSFLYDNEFLDRVSNSILNNDEAKKFLKYILFMRSLDAWSVEHVENMSIPKMRSVFNKYNELIGINNDFVINKSENVYSIVAHGDKIHKLKLI